VQVCNTLEDAEKDGFGPSYLVTHPARYKRTNNNLTYPPDSETTSKKNGARMHKPAWLWHGHMGAIPLLPAASSPPTREPGKE
jgi:hypothetical protein